jgi:hypothetical protein
LTAGLLDGVDKLSRLASSCLTPGDKVLNRKTAAMIIATKIILNNNNFLFFIENLLEF